MTNYFLVSLRSPDLKIFPSWQQFTLCVVDTQTQDKIERLREFFLNCQLKLYIN